MAKDSLEEVSPASIPTFSYLIEHLLLFGPVGAQLLIVAFENKSIQVFDF